jgi:hypothetical protein
VDAEAAPACRAEPGNVMARQQVPVPAQHRIGVHQQTDPAEQVTWEPVQQAARNAGSLRENRGLVAPSCHSRTVIW